MVARVRPAAPGDNVSDATLVQALGACAATYSQQEEDAETAKSSRSAHSNELKKWKKLGVPLEPLKRAIKDRYTDPAEVLAELHGYVRLKALQNMPRIHEDLVAMWQGIDLPDETKIEIDRQRWRDDGAFSARQGHLRESNPHHQTEASEAFSCWDQGWLNDQERIAKAMGAGAAPAAPTPETVRTGRAKPARKRKAAAPPPPPPAPASRRSRRRAEAVH